MAERIDPDPLLTVSKWFEAADVVRQGPGRSAAVTDKERKPANPRNAISARAGTNVWDLLYLLLLHRPE
jgi:hypothetical protein